MCSWCFSLAPFFPNQELVLPPVCPAAHTCNHSARQGLETTSRKRSADAHNQCGRVMAVHVSLTPDWVQSKLCCIIWFKSLNLQVSTWCGVFRAVKSPYVASIEFLCLLSCLGKTTSFIKPVNGCMNGWINKCITFLFLKSVGQTLHSSVMKAIM